MPRKAKNSKHRSQKLTIAISAEDEQKLKSWSKAYPDAPSLPETVHRLLVLELERDKRG
jgi:hypothetical protein